MPEQGHILEAKQQTTPLPSKQAAVEESRAVCTRSINKAICFFSYHRKLENPVYRL